ncbi:MAG: hypothetical protein QOF66_3171 [Mycobacterium sp.]|uniref:DUF7159 family protein n=1 Tax=Mycobacterium sp. TaxID=1785 RepID=UPI0028B95920|nr:hypothetical protein [Mycobacterium sp.]
MDIVLGVSMTPTTVRMVLVEGDKADGSIVDHDAFDITTNEGSATSLSAAEQVVEAVLGTKESAAAGGHHLKSIGVTWSDHAEASTLRDILAARGIDDVMLVSDGHAAAALAQAVGRAVGYATTALLFIDRDTATLSVVQTDDGSVVKVLSRSLHSDDAMAVLTEMAAAVDAQESPPQGMFVVGSGVDVISVKSHLEHLVSLPVSAPDEPELALARGAALASAHAPAFEATTTGLAYSQDPDGTTAGTAYPGLAAAETQLASVSGADALVDDYASQTDMEPIAEEGRKPFLLVGSALTSIFVVGVVALVISLAVSIRPTVDQRPSPGPNAIVPSTEAPAPLQEAQQPVAPPPPAETIKPPVPVAVQEAPAPQTQAPRQVFVEQAPAPQAPPPAPAAPPPPEAPPPAPIPVAPAPAPYIPAPVYNPPVYNPFLPPPGYYPRPRPWTPPWQQSDPQGPPYEPPQQEPPQYNPPPWQSPGSGGGSGSGDYPGSGSGGYPGSGSGGYPSSGSGGYPGSGGNGGSSGGSCFLIFCRR